MNDDNKLDSLLQEAVMLGKVPGVVAMIAARDGVIYQGAFGARQLGGASDMTLDSIFWLASLTKAVTSAAAMQLVERGELLLDEPLGSRYPMLGHPHVLKGLDAVGVEILEPAKNPITLRALLSHTSGYGYDFLDLPIKQYMEKKNIPRVATHGEAGFRVPLLSEPGERWRYGIGIDVVGRLIEITAGQPLGDYLKQNILEPLGMFDTDFYVEPSKLNRLVSRHLRDKDGTLSALKITPPRDGFQAGGSGLYGTARDYLRFISMVLNGGELDGVRVLSPETVREMSVNQIGSLSVGPIPGGKIPGMITEFEFLPGIEKKWGLGFLINTGQAASGRSPGSLAWFGMANCYYWIDPQEGVAGVLLMQIVPSRDKAAGDLFDLFEAETYRQLRPGADLASDRSPQSV